MQNSFLYSEEDNISSLPEQNTLEWKEWRKDKIGASDIPVIMGVSPYSTPYKLWKKKLGFEKEFVHQGMKFGLENESSVRERLQILYNTRIDHKTFVHSEIPWAIASLDGIDSDNIIYEIKSCNEKDHEIAKSGQVPEKYMPQVQWQMFVSDVNTCRYSSSHKDDLVVVEVHKDMDLIRSYLIKATEFYEHLINYTEPELTEKDHLIIDNPEFHIVAADWIKAKKNLDEAKRQEASYKKKLTELTDDSNCEGAGVRLTRVKTLGSIDWDKVCKDHKIDKLDLESYRKPSIGYWKVSII